MKRNLILVLAVVVALVLALNSYKKIGDFRSASRTVDERRVYLEELKKRNEELKKELEYKESSQFAELEIRNKLGLAKPGETVVIVSALISGLFIWHRLGRLDLVAVLKTRE